MPKAEKIKINVKDRVEDNAIDLSLSELTEVPVREIASFKRVTILDLSNNKLMSLGKTFPTLTNITRLDLSRNQIKFLPEDFGNLRNLRHLDLYNNKLEHLPLSFGNLNKLSYLDLKGNPLTPALAKVVGLCLTAKECNTSARNTVKCLARMQEEVEKTKEKLQQEHDAQLEVLADVTNTEEAQKSKKAKKAKNKSKKTKSENASPKPNPNIKLTKSKVEGNSPSNASTKRKSSTALRTIFTFFMLLAINIFIIYVIMFKNPEIAEKLVEFIPHQYRDWILTKSEYFRLRVSDWIQVIRTPPGHN
ncbi:leucine-rich repeat-containing protein 59 [Episyrphus balteatus]|uniref:leucine-rich repeat-containing protein 59 n=1 Tax=Episyrphus balteatus TaxID=286459 RepID=UPI002485B90E|nr:leucine-rich repeat-containing protein 59 [Episyrphus balteatus]